MLYSIDLNIAILVAFEVYTANTLSIDSICWFHITMGMGPTKAFLISRDGIHMLEYTIKEPSMQCVI